MSDTRSEHRDGARGDYEVFYGLSVFVQAFFPLLDIVVFCR